MRSTIRRALLTAGVSLAATAAAAAAPPEFAVVPCPDGASSSSVPLTCGVVSVPERRSASHARTIQVAVLIAHTKLPKSSDPVMLLTGGPSPIIGSLVAQFSQPGGEALLGTRDLIAIDYRGSGQSSPRLDCAADQAQLAAIEACYAALRAAGTDFAGYTTTEVAADVHAVRRALKLGPLNLWGTSYGSLIALAVARDFPDDVRSMVLDGTRPPQDPLSAVLTLEHTSAVLGLAAGCDRDAACRAAYPHLGERYERAIARLNAAPALVDGAMLTGDDLAKALFSAQTNIGALPAIPALMDQAARGTLTSLSAIGSGDDPDAGDGTASSLLLLCNSSIDPRSTRGSDRLAHADPLTAALADTLDLAFRQSCHSVPYAPAPARDFAPVVSDTPTLLFSGEYDPTLPLPEAARAARTLFDSRIVRFRGYTHVALGNGPCPVQVAQAFFDLLDPEAVDASCARELPEPQWVVGTASAR